MPEITILADNTVVKPFPKGLRGEWGFAATIDDVLFDTGQSESAVHNARLLDVPTRFDTIVLSHTHLDHTSGHDHFLDPMDKPTVYLHPEVWVERYLTETPAGDSLLNPIYLGIPFSRAEVESGGELVEHREPVEVATDVFALGEIPRHHTETTVWIPHSTASLVNRVYVPHDVVDLFRSNRIEQLLDTGSTSNRGRKLGVDDYRSVSSIHG